MKGIIELLKGCIFEYDLKIIEPPRCRIISSLNNFIIYDLSYFTCHLSNPKVFHIATETKTVWKLIFSFIEMVAYFNGFFCKFSGGAFHAKDPPLAHPHVVHHLWPHPWGRQKRFKVYNHWYLYIYIFKFIYIKANIKKCVYIYIYINITYVISIIYIHHHVCVICVCSDETLAKKVAIIQFHQKVFKKTESPTRVISTHCVQPYLHC